MASAQIQDEELQRSARALHEQDEAFEVTGAARAINRNRARLMLDQEADGGQDEDDEDVDGYFDGYEVVQESSGATSEATSGDERDKETDSEDEELYDDDADGEGDVDEEIECVTSSQNIEKEELDEDEDEEDEGVGAVKFRPGEMDEYEDEEDGNAADESVSDDSASSVSSPTDSESDIAWDEGAANDDDEEDGSENAQLPTCMFCKQDEEHDPGEEFETMLDCSVCGENAHQQCARDNQALGRHRGAESWQCPECKDSDDEPADDDEEEYVNANISRPKRRVSGPRITRDLLPVEPDPEKPDAHSVFSTLVLEEDPMDGSRVLRKRKGSSADVEDHFVAVRKRRKNTIDSAEGVNSAAESPQPPTSSRSLRLKVPNPPVVIDKHTRSSLVVRIRANSSSLRQITSRKPKGLKKATDRGGRVRKEGGASRRRGGNPAVAAAAAAEVEAEVAVAAQFPSAGYAQPFYSFYDKENDEAKGKPYGGILTEAEAETSKTMPGVEDRRRFDEAKQKAEEEWRQRLLAMQTEVEAPVRKSKKTGGPASQIECISFGGWEIDTWYAAPYPEEYSRNRVLYICEFCLKYMNSDYVAWRHKLKCPAKHPPGDEIYRYGSISMFEVDGRKNPVYCQNLCLLAKLFLGSKTLYYDVEPFLFYVLCEYDDLGYHFVGYFSKEKRQSSQNNVSCILTLPIHQRKGYGNLLIDFSYLLTRTEQRTGSPEKPLSDMGLVSYRNYWRLIMCQYLLARMGEDCRGKRGLSISQISDDTGMTPDDVIAALEGLRCLVRDPDTKLYAFRADLEYFREYVAKWEAKNYVQLNPAALTWTPYVMGRSNASNFELGPALNTIAPREEDEAHVEVVGQSDKPEGDEAESQLKSGQVNGNGVEVNGSRSDGDQVLASTEPGVAADEDRVQAPEAEAAASQTNGVTSNGDDAHSHHSATAEPDATITDKDWSAPYKEIPPSRFEVFPPVSARSSRNQGFRSYRGGVGMPNGARTGGRRRVRRPNARKSGGTGRGPGRWPKGTKKSDYGNAESGPGLPPGWLARKQEEEAEAETPEEECIEDSITVSPLQNRGGVEA